MTRKLPLSLSLFLAFGALADTADLRVSVTGPTRIERGATQFHWTATVENLGPDPARYVEIVVAADPHPCRIETAELFPAGERRTYDCTTPVTPGTYSVQMTARALTNVTPDPQWENNSAWRSADVITDPDLITHVGIRSYREDPGLPFTFDVLYRNLARTGATGAVVDVEVTGADRISRAPANCTVDGTRALCAVGAVAPSENPYETPRRLEFEVVAPDRSQAPVRIDANVRLTEPDADPANNASTATVSTYLTFTVTNTDDVGQGSLRAAIDEANAKCVLFESYEPCKIAFRIAPAGAAWQTIRPTTPLPPLLADDLIIDGSTQTRYYGDGNPAGPEIEISGSLVGETAHGLTLSQACGGFVTGLAINAFPGNGMHVAGSGCASGQGNQVRTISGNYIGTDPTGTRAVPNGRGIYVGPESSDFFAAAWISENVISGNRYSGIWVANGQYTKIFRNRIGLNATLTAGLGNGSSGVYVETPGSGTDLGDNHIGFNGHAGLSLAPGTVNVQMTYNSFQANGSLAIDHGLDGVSSSVPDGGEHAGTLRLHAPVILSARYDPVAGTTVIEGTAGGSPYVGARSIFVTIFGNDTPDESGFGEGQYLLGRADPDAGGRFTFTYRGRTPGPWIAATATSYHIWGFARTPGPALDSRGGGYATSTSEFGRTVRVSE